MPLIQNILSNKYAAGLPNCYSSYSAALAMSMYADVDFQQSAYTKILNDHGRAMPNEARKAIMQRSLK